MRPISLNSRSRFKLTTLFMALAFITLGSCTSDDDGPIGSDPKKTNNTFTLEFEPYFNDNKLSFNEMKWVTQALDTLNFVRLSFLMTHFEVGTASGEWVSLPDTVAFISPGIGRKTLQFNHVLPEGDYTKLRFYIGLDSATNHGDPSQYRLTHPLNPIVNQMHWDWAGGYIFMVTEGYFMNQGNANVLFTYHMANEEYAKTIEIQSPEAFNLRKNKGLDIKINMSAYFNTPHAFSIKEEGNTSHSISAEDRIIIEKLRANLANVFSVHKINK